MLNIVIPMAGFGSRFSNAGYVDPKPLISVHGIPMIQLVINNLRPNCDHRFIFICQESHVTNYSLDEKLKLWSPDCAIIKINGVTDGAACTVLKSKHLINNSDPVMIANSDQYIDYPINNYLELANDDKNDGFIMTMTANDPKWSYVGLDVNNCVTRVVEKQVISNEATVGIYNYKHGSDFVAAAEQMISNDERVNGEFYVAPTYNALIAQGRRIGVCNVGAELSGMYGLGIPSDLNAFLKLDLSKKAVTGL